MERRKDLTRVDQDNLNLESQEEEEYAVVSDYLTSEEIELMRWSDSIQEANLQYFSRHYQEENVMDQEED